MTTMFGDISPRTGAYAAKELLKRGLPYLVLEKFGQAKELPGNSTKTIKFRRYNALDNTPVALVEGVTPASQSLTVTDVSITLTQYGGLITISDVVQDTHEDPVLNESVTLLGEQAAQVVERVRYGTLRAGVNVLIANGVSRSAINTPVSISVQRRAVRALKRQNARPITEVLKSSPAYNTQPIEAGFVALVHPDLENDIRSIDGFVSTKHYASMQPMEGEIGAIEDVRYIRSTVFEPWADAGGAHGGTVLSTSGTSADVYPVLYLARDAFGCVPLKGRNAITPQVKNPTVSETDPLGQRGVASWKCWNATVILQDAFLIRAEVAASE